MMATSIINTDFARTSPAQTALTVLGLGGVVLVFLPFIDSYVPVEVFLEGLEDFELFGLAPLLGPFVVLPFFICAGYLRWVLTGELSRWEGWVGYALALIVVVLLSLLIIIIQAWWELGFDEEMLFVAFLALGLGAGAWFVVQNLRHGAPPTLTALVAMQLAYLPFALGWLWGPISVLIEDYASISDMPIGADFAFLTVLVYTAQAALSLRGQPRLPFRLLPLGLVWVGGLTAGFLAWS